MSLVKRSRKLRRADATHEPFFADQHPLPERRHRGAELRPRFDVVFEYLDLDEALDDVDLVITGEGSLDHQTPRGKVPAEVASRAAARGIPTVAIAGTLGAGVEANRAAGIDGWMSAMDRPMDLTTAIEECSELVRNATAQMLRFVVVGQRLAGRVSG